MIDTSKRLVIAVAATLAFTSSAFAQVRPTGVHATATASRAPLTVNRNDPAITGGGSLGYNQTVEHGW